MIQPSFLLFELLMYGLFAACLWHALRQDRTRVMELFLGLFYGVFLEWMTLHQVHTYDYGQFLIMFDGAPLAVGAGWAIIIYASMELTNRLHLPDYARPFMTGLLALNIDAAMDAVAIRIGFWTWGGLTLEQEWFGVPWGNFWAWFIVVTAFAGFLGWFRVRGWHRDRRKRWLYGPFTFMLSILILAFTNDLYTSTLWPAGFGLHATVVLIGLGILIVALARPRVARPGPLDPVVFAVPLTFHLFFNIAGFTFGFYQDVPGIAIAGIVMLVAGLVLHLWPWWAGRRRPAAEDSASPAGQPNSAR